MSEILLNAIIHLYAILAASLDGEKRLQATETLKRYLRDYLHLYNIDDYTGLYEDFITLYEGPDSLLATRSAELVAGRMGAELPLRERYIVVLRFIEMLSSFDTHNEQKADELIDIIIKEFSLDRATVSLMRGFCHINQKYKRYLPDDKSDIYTPKHAFDNLLSFIYIREADTIFVRNDDSLQKIQLNDAILPLHSVSEFIPGSIVTSDAGERVTYSEVAAHYFRTGLPEVNFSARNLEFHFSDSDNGLHNFSFETNSGELVGIMGGSGAGKSTLLNILNGTCKPGSGNLYLNGNDIYENPEASSGSIGYVPQDDLLFNDLTVFDNLYYRARLCLDDLDDAQIRARVYSVLRELGQEETAHLKVGSPLEKTISGGQRKRLNIALELIRSPAVLFVDEPTSGLSSADSENVITMLRKLANTGRLVFVVIHQPSSTIFRSFDRLWLMDQGGYPVYDGSPIDAIRYFRSESWQAGSDEGICHTCGNINPEQIFKIIQRRKIGQNGSFTSKRKVSPQKWHEKYLSFINDKFKDKPVKTDEPVENLSTLQTPSLLQQFIIFFKRNLKSRLSNRQYLLINLLEPPLLGLFAALLCRGYNESEVYTFGANANIGVFFFISIIIALFMGLSISAEEIIRDRKILRQEKFLKLSWFSYLNSKTAYLFALSALQMLIYTLVTLPILQIPDMTLTMWLMMFSCAATSALLGLNISASMRSAVSVYILIPLILIPQMLLSGAVISYGNLIDPKADNRYPPVFAEIMPSRWGYEALVVRQYKNNDYMRKIFNEEITVRGLDFELQYRLPELRSLADYKFIATDKPEYHTTLKRNLNILKNEVAYLEQLSGIKADLAFDNGNFNKAELTRFRDYLSKVRKTLYASRQAANENKKNILNQLKEELGSEGLRKFREYNHNTNIESLALSRDNLKPFILTDNRLLQIAAPITIKPDNPFGRTQFLSPQKLVAGHKISTYKFNLLVLWLIITLFYLALLLQLLPRIMKNSLNN